MTKSIFTEDQRAWLKSFAEQFKDRIKTRENGTQFGRECAGEFVKKWSSLADGQTLTSEEITQKVISWFKDSISRVHTTLPLEKNKPREKRWLISGGTLPLSAVKIGNESSMRRERRKDRLLSVESEEQVDVGNDSQKQTVSDVNNNSYYSESSQNNLAQDASDVGWGTGGLLKELKNVFQSHPISSFHLLLALPSIEPNGPPIVSRLQSTSIRDFPNFESYFGNDEDIYCKWKEYAAAIEKKRDFILKLKQLITLDTNGFPEVPVMGYDLKELGEALTVYLEQTWYKMHVYRVDSIGSIPWSEVELNPAQYLKTSALPPSLLPFRAPNKSSAPQIIELHGFLEDNADKPFFERFPFIVQSKVPAQPTTPTPESPTRLYDIPRLIMVQNWQEIGEDSSSSDETRDRATPTKRRRSGKSKVE